MEIDLNTRDSQEYRKWLALLNEIQEIHQTIKENPNTEGLKIARTIAYNILADIHDLIDQTENSDKSAPHDNATKPN